MTLGDNAGVMRMSSLTCLGQMLLVTCLSMISNQKIVPGLEYYFKVNMVGLLSIQVFVSDIFVHFSSFFFSPRFAVTVIANATNIHIKRSPLCIHEVFDINMIHPDYNVAQQQLQNNDLAMPPVPEAAVVRDVDFGHSFDEFSKGEHVEYFDGINVVASTIVYKATRLGTFTIKRRQGGGTRSGVPPAYIRPRFD